MDGGVEGGREGGSVFASSGRTTPLRIYTVNSRIVLVFPLCGYVLRQEACGLLSITNLTLSIIRRLKDLFPASASLTPALRVAVTNWVCFGLDLLAMIKFPASGSRMTSSYPCRSLSSKHILKEPSKFRKAMTLLDLHHSLGNLISRIWSPTDVPKTAKLFRTWVCSQPQVRTDFDYIQRLILSWLATNISKVLILVESWQRSYPRMGTDPLSDICVIYGKSNSWKSSETKHSSTQFIRCL
jgi:hypothetical protein